MRSEWFGLIGPLAMIVVLIALGILSRRLGATTRATPYYIGFYIAALLILISLIARIANLILGFADDAMLNDDLLWTLLYAGLPALGVTLGLVMAWRYWSWLLAERD
jgi:hypothetical protein